MLIKFGTKYSYELIDKLPQVGDVRYGRNGVDELCTEVSDALWGEVRNRAFERYAPYTVVWEEQTENGEKWLDRVCVEREDFAE